MICVSPSELKIIIAIFKKHILKGEVRAFGSRYKWQCKDYSDLDIAIDIGRTMTSEELEAVEDDFIESDLPYRVDVLDYNGISAEFRAVIDKGCEVVYKANGWKKVRLGEVCSKIGSGATPRGGKEAYKDSGMAFIRSQNILDFTFSLDGLAYIDDKQAEQLKNVCVEEGDVLLNITGDSVARTCVVPSQYLPARVNQHVSIIRGKKQAINNLYILYYLQYHKPFLLSISSSGGTRNALTKSMIENLEIVLPPLSEQKRIATILSSLDDKIELNNRINKTLEEMAQAIFKSWFVDFEPFLDGEFEDSELGKIPKGWRVGTLLDIADYLNGLAMQRFRPLAGEDGLTVLKIKELRQGVCDSSSDLCSPTIRSDYIVRDGDVIFSWSGSLVLDFWCGGECGLNQHLFKVTSTKYDKWFYYSWTCHHLARFIAMAADKATTMGHIKREALENAKVIVPINDDYRVLNKLMTPLYEKIINNRVENRRLATIRGTLLPKLMSGELLT